MDWHALFSRLPGRTRLVGWRARNHGPSSSAHRHTRKQIHARTDFYRQIQASHEQKNRTIRVDDRKRRENAQDLFIYLADKSRLMEYLERSRMKKGAGRVTDTCGMMEGWWNSPAEPEKDTPTCLLAFCLFVSLREKNRWRMLIRKEIAAIRSNVAQSVASFRASVGVCLSRRSGRTAKCWGGVSEDEEWSKKGGLVAASSSMTRQIDWWHSDSAGLVRCGGWKPDARKVLPLWCCAGVWDDCKFDRRWLWRGGKESKRDAGSDGLFDDGSTRWHWR